MKISLIHVFMKVNIRLRREDSSVKSFQVKDEKGRYSHSLWTAD